MTIFIPAKDTPGKAFMVTAIKSSFRGRPNYLTADEVTLPKPGESGFDFTWVPMQARKAVETFEGNNTKGNRAKALPGLMQKLIDNGWIDPADALKAID